MKTSSLRENRPHLEGVLGPLSAEDDEGIRATLAAVDAVLLEIAGHVGGSRAGWEGTGLELAWMESGQTAISSFVAACIAEGDCVDFCIELRPSWYYGQRSPMLTWEIETSIQADCQDPYGNNTMNTVHKATIHAATAPEAASVLRMAAHELHRLAKGFPLEHWVQLTKPRTG